MSTQARWRTGRQVGRTIYAVAGTGDHTDDHLIGLMDTSELAAAIVADHNRALDGEGDGLRAVIEAAREFADAQTAWREIAQRGEPVKPTDDVVHRRAAATATLICHVQQLDADTRPKEG